MKTTFAWLGLAVAFAAHSATAAVYQCQESETVVATNITEALPPAFYLQAAGPHTLRQWHGNAWRDFCAPRRGDVEQCSVKANGGVVRGQALITSPTDHFAINLTLDTRHGTYRQLVKKICGGGADTSRCVAVYDAHGACQPSAGPGGAQTSPTEAASAHPTRRRHG